MPAIAASVEAAVAPCVAATAVDFVAAVSVVLSAAAAAAAACRVTPSRGGQLIRSDGLEI